MYARAANMFKMAKNWPDMMGQEVIFFFLAFICSSANKCLLKVATYAAQLEQYQKAVEIYEQVKSLFLILTFVFIA
ncbi:hypothetical protein AB205_0189650, partial [Aquarana catesbeiana]